MRGKGRQEGTHGAELVPVPAPLPPSPGTASSPAFQPPLILAPHVGIPDPGSPRLEVQWQAVQRHRCQGLARIGEGEGLPPDVGGFRGRDHWVSLDEGAAAHKLPGGLAWVVGWGGKMSALVWDTGVRERRTSSCRRAGCSGGQARWGCRGKSVVFPCHAPLLINPAHSYRSAGHPRDGVKGWGGEFQAGCCSDHR